MRHSSLRVPVRDTWKRVFFKTRERGEWRKYLMYIDLFELLLRFSFLSRVFYSNVWRITVDRTSDFIVHLINRNRSLNIIINDDFKSSMRMIFVISWIFFSCSCQIIDVEIKLKIFSISIVVIRYEMNVCLI